LETDRGKNHLNKLYYILLFLSLFFASPGSAWAVSVGDTLPAVSANDMDGNLIELEKIVGNKPLMLIFWASWCSRCRESMPWINELFDKYHEQGLQFIGINIGYNDSKSKARRFMEETGISYPVIFDEKGGIPIIYGVYGVPTILVADKNGIIIFHNNKVPEISDHDFQLLSH